MNTTVKIVTYVLGLVLAATTGWYLSNYFDKPEPINTKDFIATVNGKGLDKSWFISQMKLRGGLKPGQFQTVEQKKALLDFLVDEEILFQQAIEHGVADDPAISRLYKNAVIDKFTTENLNKKLEQVKVRDSEAQSYFDKNLTAYNKPARRRAAIIAVEFNENTDEDEMAKKLNRIKAAKDAVDQMDLNINHFGELAKVYSDDRASMYQGGVIGWLINHPSRKYKWDQSVVETLFKLEKPGETSDIITTDNGYYLVRLVAAENIREKTFEQVKRGIKNQLTQAKRKQAKTDFMAEITNGAKVEINQDMLAALPALSAPRKNDNKPPSMPSVGGAQ